MELNGISAGLGASYGRGLQRGEAADGADADQRLKAEKEDAEAKQSEAGQLRKDVFREFRRLPDADEEVEIAEIREEVDGESILRAVQVVKELIPLKPEEAARAQANLDPQRLAILLGA